MNQLNIIIRCIVTLHLYWISFRLKAIIFQFLQIPLFILINSDFNW